MITELPFGHNLPLFEGLVGLPSTLLMMPSSVTCMRFEHECRHILQVELIHLPDLRELAVGALAAMAGPLQPFTKNSDTSSAYIAPFNLLMNFTLKIKINTTWDECKVPLKFYK
jgi:hypothetical protein